MKRERCWRLVDLGVHGYARGFKLSEGPRCMDHARSRLDREVDYTDIESLDTQIRFLINHCCHNCQFMAPRNAGTTFFFNQHILAEWGWSGAGTIEHQALHQALKDDYRFGIATMKNCDKQMIPGSNPWRTYFTVVLGDPFLRIFYK